MSPGKTLPICICCGDAIFSEPDNTICQHGPDFAEVIHRTLWLRS